MEIRNAVPTDLEEIMDIYGSAREFMRQKGNPGQWGDGYPRKELVEEDIRRNQCFVMSERGILCGVFVFLLGEDPTYVYIEDGSWKNDVPYGVIHRLAGNGKCKGVFRRCLSFCKDRIPNLRVDTHRDNTVMRRLLEENGFSFCGTIYVREKSPRLAYQWTKNSG